LCEEQVVERTDVDLLEAARRDPEAFRLFYERHVAAVFTWLRSRTESADDAKVTADAYTAADEAVEPNGIPPACRGVVFALEQVGLVFAGTAPPSDLMPGAQATYEEVAGGRP
jgi:hypothetical protein